MSACWEPCGLYVPEDVSWFLTRPDLQDRCMICGFGLEISLGAVFRTMQKNIVHLSAAQGLKGK